MRIAIKVLKLKQVENRDGNVSVIGFTVDEEKWDLREVSDIPGGVDVHTRLLEVAAEYMVREKTSGVFTITEVETTGQRVLIGEGDIENSSTLLSPRPQYLRRILFVKCTSPENCRVIYEFKPSSQLILYEGSLATTNLDYDFIIIEGSDYSRVLFPHELLLPKARVEATTTKKRRKRKKKITSRSRKKKSKKRRKR